MKRWLLGSLIIGAVLVAIPSVGSASRGESRKGADPEELRAFLAGLLTALQEFVKGRPAAVKALWSHGDDVSIAGGYGGKVARGWTEVEHRLDWASSQYSEGTARVEEIVANVGRDSAYVVQIERTHFKKPGTSQEVSEALRVTMIFRREGAVWRLVHRHADAQMTRGGSR